MIKININKKVVMELVDMNSLGLFDFFLILSVQVGFTLYYILLILIKYLYVVD